MKNKEYTIGLSLDFQKAFDKTQHDILLTKMSRYGIRGVALGLIENYLEQRYQYVTLSNFIANKLKIKHDVP